MSSINPEIYEIFADEAWTHSAPPLRRYWCFLGGVFGSMADLDRLDKGLKQVKSRFGYRAEAKWAKITLDNLSCYKALVDCFFDHLENHELRYRQLFLDRSYVHYESYLANPEDMYGLEIQFKLYYQMFKHLFDLRYMPKASGGIKIYLRLDDHSSQKHKDKLEEFVVELPAILERPDIQILVSYVNSSLNDRVQICDLLMGAAGSHGNKMQSIRAAGKRGMTPKQKVRDEFCKYVYNKLKNLNCKDRRKNGFNWFESTGGAPTPKERYKHKIRIWKFIPKKYLKDKGWENDHLNGDGSYRGPEIDSAEVFDLDSRLSLDSEL